ncbi:hypothetical protein [Desulfovibrio sp. ZJ369]|uniref:hypothetical protein n=1 Tax=Desulfovibrio sp. ZJ369 TaxID=2709793 RepID=UPI0013EA8DA6|nr:hypothetical protein [Desulfovibrio sp. ZJ369]
MGMDTQIDLSKFSGKKVTKEQEERLRKVAASLQIREDDALWPLLQALEYQRTFYVELPDKIGTMSNTIMDNMRETARKEAEKTQASLTKSVVEEARYLASKIQWGEVVPMIIMGIIAMFAYSAACMWAGFQLGALEVRPLHDILLVPWMPLASLGIIFTGIAASIPAVNDFAHDREYGKLHLALSLIAFIGGIVALCVCDVAVWDRILK